MLLLLFLLSADIRDIRLAQKLTFYRNVRNIQPLELSGVKYRQLLLDNVSHLKCRFKTVFSELLYIYLFNIRCIRKDKLQETCSNSFYSLCVSCSGIRRQL